MDEAHSDIRDLIWGIARRILRRRMLESAAVVAVAGGLCAAAVELAWMLAAVAPVAAAVICGAAALAAPAVLAFAGVRRRLHLPARQAVCAAAVCLLAGLAGLAGVLSGAHALVSQAVVGAIVLSAGALTGAAAAWLRGIAPLDAAILVDGRCGLDEQLATAVELADSPRAQTPAARCLYARAAEALRTDSGELKLWTRTRATAAALALVTLLCLTLAIPTIGGRPGSLRGLSGPARRETADSLRRAARESRSSDPALAEDLDRAAIAVEVSDEQELERIRRRLAARNIRLERVVDAKIAAILTAATGGGSAEAASAPPTPGTRPAAAATRPRPLAEVGHVRVYDPEYAKLLSARRAAAAAPKPTPVGPGEFVHLDDAWSRARRRAEADLSAGKVPAQYRPLIRNFFATD